MAGPSQYRLLVVPIVITLGVTILRLVGELQHWSPQFFSRQPGGLGAIVGIIWLAPVFGVYFARSLRGRGQLPASLKRAGGHTLGAVCLLVGWGGLNAWLWPPFQVQVLGATGVAIGIAFLQLRGWPELGRLLLLYAMAARIPVVVIMYFAIFGQWKTHYDAFPAGFPLTDPFQIWLWAGLLVQMTFWVGASVVLGAAFGTMAAMTGVWRFGKERKVT